MNQYDNDNDLLLLDDDNNDNDSSNDTAATSNNARSLPFSILKRQFQNSNIEDDYYLYNYNDNDEDYQYYCNRIRQQQQHCHRQRRRRKKHHQRQQQKQRTIFDTIRQYTYSKTGLHIPYININISNNYNTVNPIILMLKLRKVYKQSLLPGFNIHLGVDIITSQYSLLNLLLPTTTAGSGNIMMGMCKFHAYIQDRYIGGRLSIRRRRRRRRLHQHQHHRSSSRLYDQRQEVENEEEYDINNIENMAASTTTTTVVEYTKSWLFPGTGKYIYIIYILFVGMLLLLHFAMYSIAIMLFREREKDMVLTLSFICYVFNSSIFSHIYLSLYIV
jgi:hypothetical protein